MLLEIETFLSFQQLDFHLFLFLFQDQILRFQGVDVVI